MKVNYTLPGLMPGSTLEPGGGTGQPVESFGAQLQRLRVPKVTDWREVLRLNTRGANTANLGPPPVPRGIESRAGAPQRAWWRGMLQKHVSSTVSGASNEMPVQYMLEVLRESQRLEDRIFARHFAEDGG
jgi:hypothetical protein